MYQFSLSLQINEREYSHQVRQVQKGRYGLDPLWQSNMRAIFFLPQLFNFDCVVALAHLQFSIVYLTPFSSSFFCYQLHSHQSPFFLQRPPSHPPLSTDGLILKTLWEIHLLHPHLTIHNHLRHLATNNIPSPALHHRRNPALHLLLHRRLNAHPHYHPRFPPMAPHRPPASSATGLLGPPMAHQQP